MNELATQDVIVGDYIIRFWDGKPGKPEEIVSIHAVGVCIKDGVPFICGYSDYFGNAPKSMMSFSISERDEKSGYYVKAYRQVA